jgi:hypothetical protein
MYVFAEVVRTEKRRASDSVVSLLAERMLCTDGKTLSWSACRGLEDLPELAGAAPCSSQATLADLANNQRFRLRISSRRCIGPPRR